MQVAIWMMSSREVERNVSCENLLEVVYEYDFDHYSTINITY